VLAGVEGLALPPSLVLDVLVVVDEDEEEDEEDEDEADPLSVLFLLA